MRKCNWEIRGIGPFNLAACVVIFSLYNMLSSTIELCAAVRHNCSGSGADSIAAFNIFSSSFTIIAGTLGILSTITKSPRFVLVVLITSIITMICDGAELVTNSTSAAPSVFQFVMSALHLCVNTVAMVVFLSYYQVLKKGGTGRERPSAFEDINSTADAAGEERVVLPPPKTVTEETPLMA